MSGNTLDKLDQEISEGAASPVSGVNVAIGAGGALTGVMRRRALLELPAYFCVQCAWFTAFGLQTVIFPYLLKNELHVSGTLLGLAQMALAAPSVVFILLGGVVAERAEGKVLLATFHLSASVPAALLAFALSQNALHYWMLVIYAAAMGTIGAFMMPARDAILNAVIDRRRAAGSSITLQQGVAVATLAQFAAQIVGLILGGQAQNGVWPLMALLSAVMASGAIAAVFLDRARMPATDKGRSHVLADISDGMKAVRADPVLFSMVASMFGVGVFVIGAFLVVLPIINADVYKSESGGLSNIFVIFWAGAFCSSVAISRFKRVSRPGRLLLIAQGLGSLGILAMIGRLPYPLFLGLVFIWGLAAGVSIMMSRLIVQEAAPPHLLARILSIYQLGFMGGAPIGAALMGVIADQAGPQLVILAPAAGMLAMIALMLVFTPIWRMEPKTPSALSAAPGP
jgi:MFS family permease